MSSNFEKTINFNKSFNVPTFETVQNNIFTENPKLVEFRLKLIREEVQELEEAVKNHDMAETIDALADILYVVYGAGVSLGINLDKAFNIVHESNMSKMCKTEEIAKRTVEKYKDDYKMKKHPYDSPDYKPSKSGFIVYNKSTGKVLKSIEYNAVDFSNYSN